MSLSLASSFWLPTALTPGEHEDLTPDETFDVGRDDAGRGRAMRPDDFEHQQAYFDGYFAALTKPTVLED